MKIAILGTGNVGQALGGGWARGGHAVLFGTREPAGEKARAVVEAVGGGATAVAHQTAVDAADVVVVATPWAATEALLTGLRGWAGKVLVDATNPIAPGLQLAVGKETSGGELVAGWAPGARVVKAFNTTGYNNMADPVYAGESTTMFIAGDDAAAKATVAALAEELGFDVADVGGLAAARFLEPLALVWIRLARGLGREIALKLVRR
ncbi:MAG: NAD(P)-binding domain-containing protein [Anaerolineales bacterium]|nr:NAD(P)-binding domain-containing protein [Anaerolineales bacterium]